MDIKGNCQYQTLAMSIKELLVSGVDREVAVFHVNFFLLYFLVWYSSFAWYLQKSLASRFFSFSKLTQVWTMIKYLFIL